MRKIGSPGAADRYEKMKKEREEEIGEKSKQKSYFDVLGLCCSSEVPLIEKILTPLQGVFDVSVIVPSKTVIVLHDPLLISQLQIVNELNKARLEANVKVYGQKNKKKRWPSPYAVASGVLLALSVTLKYVYHPLEFLALGAVAVGIIPMLFKAIASIRNFSLDINTLMILAVGGSIALRDYWEAGTIVFLFTTAEWLESRASHRATAAMSLLANIVPQTAVIAETGEQVKANQVLVNTVVAVKPGDVIPIDGVVVQGKCDVDEKTLTGESFPVSKQVDSTVWAGTINLNGYISVTTTARAEDCVVARMANLVEEAQKNKSKTQRFIDKGAKYYTPIVVAVSACIAISPLVFKVHNASERYHLALVVLVSACPCALILSTPVATCCGLSKAAKSGLLVKGGEYLETFSKIKIMAFDKTGTITKGEFVIMDFKPLLRDVDLNTLLYWVSSIESKSSHPMAAAIIDYAESHSIEPKADNVEDFQNFPGEGIFGKIDGKDIFVGNKRIAIRAGCATIPPLENDAKDRGKSIGYIFLGSSPAGVFSLSDVCRTGVKQAITELKTMGMKTAMLTGDSEAAANHAQAQLGGALQIVRAELLPEDKARIIKEFQTVSPTAMVGDGLNDAAALATADIGISMGISGSALAMDTGNIILMSNDIRKIPKCARLARRTRRKIFENMFLAIITKVAIIALAIAGHPLVWAAVLADVGTCLLVIFNSMLLLGIPKRNGGRTSAGHDHKHGIKSNHSHSPHIHKNCCSGTETGEKHKPQKCSSQKCATECHFETFSPASGKCATSSEKHGCCTNPSQAQEGKHNTAASNSISHSHKQCCSGNQAEKRGCSDIQAVKKCMPEVCPPKDQLDCSCQESCGNLKRLESAETHGCCEHNYEIIEEESHVNHGCCEHDEIIEEGKHVNHGCCEHDEIIEEGKHINHGCCEHDEIIEGKHVNHGCENNDTLIEEEEHKSHGNHGCCEHDGRVDVEKHMDHGFHEELHSTKPNSCAEDKCMDSIEKGDGHCDELHKEKQGEHGSSGTKNHDADSHHHHNHHHDHDHPHHNHDHHHHIHPPHDHDHDHDHVGGSTEVGQHKHCHSDHHGNVRVHKEYITEEELSSMVKDCCKHGTEHGDISSSSSGKNHVECCTSSSSKVCSSLRKRHNGGCCQSFRRECCGASPQFEVGFRGGLSEIIID